MQKIKKFINWLNKIGNNKIFDTGLNLIFN